MIDGEERQLDFAEREIVLRANFAELDDEECLDVSVRFIMQGPRQPRPGEWVYLLDRGGCGCLGQVQLVEGWMARVKPDWSSWVGEDKPPVPRGAWRPTSAHSLPPAAGDAP
jgi:hypothetical protein